MARSTIRILILPFLLSALLFGCLIYFQTIQNGDGVSSIYKYHPYYSSQSTDPGNPHILYDDSSVYEYYNASTSYFYKTDNASPPYYQAIWLSPDGASSNFDLYLYNDSTYSTLIKSSNRGVGNPDWVVFRPNLTQNLYVKVTTISGLGGFAFIEWEDSSDNLTVNSSVSGYLNSPDILEVYQIYLSNTSAYRFRLDVPSTGDFDLWLYQLDPGDAVNYAGAVAYSWTMAMERIEIISNYTPSESGYHALLVVRSSGSGNYVLSASSFPTTLQVLVDDVSLNETCNASTSTYYQTGSASPSYYHVVWCQSHAVLDNFDLFLFSDSEFSNHEADSLRGAGLLEWVVFRPSASQPYYMEVYAQEGSNGNVSIEWEDSSESLSIGTSVSASLSLTNCIEMYEIYLSNSFEYRFSLGVPAGGDYDLYLYSLSPGMETNYGGYLRCSTTSGNGVDEIIGGYKPTTTGDYALMVVRSNGTGSYLLNMSSLQELHDDIAEFVQYPASTSYYYRTDLASALYYHVVWMQPTDALDNFDLWLYSDTNFSSYLGASQRPSGALEWVVFQPNISQTFYPKVNALGGSSGDAYIEWEDSSDPFYYSGASGILSSSDCVEIYDVLLFSFSRYTFTLEVPSTGDFDLYLYYLDNGAAADTSGWVIRSATVGNGIDETISRFEPTLYGSYALLVVRSNGTGTFHLSYDFDSSTPFWPFSYYLPFLIGAGIAGLVIALVVLIRKRRHRQETPFQYRTHEVRLEVE